MYNGSKEVKDEANHRKEVLGIPGQRTGQRGAIRKGKSRGYFGKINGVSGRGESQQIVTRWLCYCETQQDTPQAEKECHLYGTGIGPDRENPRARGPP